jgi:DNA-binding transcriptional LysR family regulator
MYRLYQPILLDLRNASQLMMELRGKVTGKIAIGIIPSITNSVLADVLSRFGATYPDVEIRIDEAYSGTLIDWVAIGDLDVAIVNGTRRKSGISAHPLVEEELLLVERRSTYGRLEPIASLLFSGEATAVEASVGWLFDPAPSLAGWPCETRTQKRRRKVSL